MPRNCLSLLKKRSTSHAAVMGLACSQSETDRSTVGVDDGANF
jgi:hypothetical protein